MGGTKPSASKPVALAAAAVVVGVSGVALSSSDAGAWEAIGSCYHYPAAWDDDGLGIAYHSANYEGNRANATGSAALNWNWQVAPQWTPTSYNYYMDLGVHFAWLGHSLWPAGVHLSCTSGGYNQIPILEWNLNSTHSNPDSWLKTVATGVHELGHAYGLAHNQTGGCDESVAGWMFAPSVIKYNQCVGSWGLAPTNDDIKGQIFVHP